MGQERVSARRAGENVARRKGQPRPLPPRDKYEKSEGRLLVFLLIPQLDRLIFGLGSVYRAFQHA